METRECIKTRRSIRRFTDEPVSDEMLVELLEAFRWSPSWANTQVWEVVVVKDQALKEKLAGCVPEKNPGHKAVLQAPIVFAVCCKLGSSGYKGGELLTDKGDWYMFDAGIASQNLCLAAHDLGLGSVHVGTLNHKVIDELLGLPADIKSVEIIPVGHPAKEGAAPPRKELETFVYADRYGQKVSF
ncbi:MAG: nitroreductase family protein [Bacillota bacterium]|nr:nitroreductase family protein [Bacillota bacterium]